MVKKTKSYRYCVLSEQGLTARTTMKTCWNCERIFFGVNGWAPGSWKTMVTISLPMWRLRSSCWRLFGVNGRSVETWNMISQSWYCEYTEYRPVESAGKHEKLVNMMHRWIMIICLDVNLSDYINISSCNTLLKTGTSKYKYDTSYVKRL